LTLILESRVRHKLDSFTCVVETAPFKWEHGQWEEFLASPLGQDLNCSKISTGLQLLKDLYVWPLIREQYKSRGQKLKVNDMSEHRQLDTQSLDSFSLSTLEEMPVEDSVGSTRSSGYGDWVKEQFQVYHEKLLLSAPLPLKMESMTDLKSNGVNNLSRNIIKLSFKALFVYIWFLMFDCILGEFDSVNGFVM
jgi:hypothetical protein